jgi:hypothetical protein
MRIQLCGLAIADYCGPQSEIRNPQYEAPHRKCGMKRRRSEGVLRLGDARIVQGCRVTRVDR